MGELRLGPGALLFRHRLGTRRAQPTRAGAGARGRRESPFRCRCERRDLHRTHRIRVRALGGPIAKGHGTEKRQPYQAGNQTYCLDHHHVVRPRSCRVSEFGKRSGRATCHRVGRNPEHDRQAPQPLASPLEVLVHTHAHPPETLVNSPADRRGGAVGLGGDLRRRSSLDEARTQDVAVDGLELLEGRPHRHQQLTLEGVVVGGGHRRIGHARPGLAGLPPSILSCTCKGPVAQHLAQPGPHPPGRIRLRERGHHRVLDQILGVPALGEKVRQAAKVPEMDVQLRHVSIRHRSPDLMSRACMRWLGPM